MQLARNGARLSRTGLLRAIHQSDLQSWNRCPQEFFLTRRGSRTDQTSASAYGTVIHHALHVLERTRDLDKALQTFLYFWHPLNIDQLTDPIPLDGWLPRQSYSSLRTRGIRTLRAYADMIGVDDHELLALELPFAVPLRDANGRSTEFWLCGTIDRLAVRWYRGVMTLCIDDWKAMPLDTPVATPVGWSTIGDLRVGDEVFDRFGEPTRIVGKSPVFLGRPVYRVSFDDGSTLLADDQHQWKVWVGRSRHEVEKVLNTGELAAQLALDGDERLVRIFNPEPLLLAPSDLPIDPYVLGVWLGDGKHTSGEVTNPDPEVWQQIRHSGYGLGSDTGRDCPTRTVLGLRTQLREQGLLGHKHVPAAYLRASVGQRLALLQGLMDSDGSWNRPRRHAVFCTIDAGLRDAVAELVASLGWTPRVFEVQRTGFGKTVTAYDVCFTPTWGNPFRLRRKAALVPAVAPANARRRMVVSVEQVESVATQCIAVASLDRTFLAGRTMIATHNSGKQKWGLRHNVQGHAYAYATHQPEFWTGVDVELDRLLLGPKRYVTPGFGDQAESLAQRFRNVPRRFTWINLTENSWVDGGYRTEQDFERLRLAVQQVSTSVDAGIFPLRIDGETCKFCPVRKVCGGVGLPEQHDGDPLFG